MKKILLFSLCFLMVAVFMVGCTSTNGASDGTAAPSSTPPASSEEDNSAGQELPRYKIGMADMPASPETLAINAQLDGIAEAFNCEVVHVEMPTMDLEGLLSAHEALIKADVDGILSMSVTPAMAQQCIDAEIPFALFSASATDPVLLDVVKGSPYFVGSFGMDGVQVGYDAAQTAYDGGYRNICYVAPGLGNETHDQWVQGIEDFATDHPDFKIVSSSRDAYTAPSIDLFRKMYSAFPDIECVIETSNDQTIIPGLYTDGLQSKVKYATLSLPGDVSQAYEDGCVILTGVGASGYVNPSFAALYNVMSGHNLISDNTIPVIVGYITIANSEEYAKYLNTIQKEPFFSADELKQFCPVFNPDATYDAFVEACAKLSLQDIVERHNITE